MDVEDELAGIEEFVLDAECGELIADETLFNADAGVEDGDARGARGEGRVHGGVLGKVREFRSAEVPKCGARMREVWVDG